MVAESILRQFTAIDLDSLTRCRLMDRYTTKYIVDINLLNVLLQIINRHYGIVEINEGRKHSYSTIYYDTPDDDMYHAHHNGKLNRYKIRHRTYAANGLSFLEIKQRQNKGITTKNRIYTHGLPSEFSGEQIGFINKNTPYQAEELDQKLNNQYTRLTLISHSSEERSTIDYDLQFTGNGRKAVLNDIAIIEIKKPFTTQSSAIERYLAKKRVSPQSFSKYCIGRLLTDPGIKYNRFKPRVLQMNKMGVNTKLTA